MCSTPNGQRAGYQHSALLGRNGVGKSTTIKSIIGFTLPRRGQIMVRGVDVTQLSSHRTAQLSVGLVPQGCSIFPTLTVRENIMLAARQRPMAAGLLSGCLRRSHH